MKNALITGATKGMGRAIAMAFAREEINLAVCSRNEKELADLKQELSQINQQINVFTSVTDCSVKSELLDFATTAEQELGFIDILVNNVGTFIPSSILNDNDDTFSTQLNLNLMPTYHLYRHFGKTMIAEGIGHIFNICSIASINPAINAGSYSVTKFALLGLTKVMRLETQAHGVKVTAIIPGSTLTDSWKGIEVDASQFVMPEDIAAAIVSIYNMSAGANVDEMIIKPVGGQV